MSITATLVAAAVGVILGVRVGLTWARSDLELDAALRSVGSARAAGNDNGDDGTWAEPRGYTPAPPAALFYDAPEPATAPIVNPVPWWPRRRGRYPTH